MCTFTCGILLVPQGQVHLGKCLENVNRNESNDAPCFLDEAYRIASIPIYDLY